MKENQESRTALLTAYLRGYHSEHVNPKIFDDFMANKILTVEERNSFDQYILSGLKAFDPKLAASFPDEATALAFSMQIIAGSPQVLSRARFTEDLLEEAVKQGIKQYVILGAGLDTFAFRHPEILEQLQVFEVDHPDTQNYKLHRLEELKWEIPPQMHFVPVDFTKESLATALTSASYDPTALTFFNWLGVTYYLSYDVVLSTLSTIADISSAGSIVVFDYLDTDAFDSEKAAPRVKGMLFAAQQMGEKMNIGFNPSSLMDELNKVSLNLQENLGPSDIQARYFQGRPDKYYALEHLHLASVKVK